MVHSEWFQHFIGGQGGQGRKTNMSDLYME